MSMFIRKVANKVKKLLEPELKRIPIENIEFAPYQRELKQSKVNKIAKEFIPEIVGVALISFRQGRFWCLDSQHRIKAMEKLGYTDVYCIILTGLSYEEECRYFNVLNTGRTQLTANQVFHCRVEEKDPDALELVNLFHKYRYDYNKNNGTKSDNTIGAVSKFVSMQKNYGNTMVDKVLRIMRNAWFGEKSSLSSAIITGLATFLNEKGEVDELCLVKALEQIVPDNLISQANGYVKLNLIRPGRADSACYHVAKLIEQLYEEELYKSKKGRKSKAV